jgi:PAS domain S-box-containing protein
MFKFKYFWPYLLFFFSIAVLVWVNVSAINMHVERNRAFAHTINIAGRQRMLSEQIVKNCYSLYTGADKRSIIMNDLDKWNDIHYDLQNDGERFHLHKLDFKDRDSLYELLNPIQQQIFSDVKLAVNEGMTEPRLHRIAQHQAEFLPLMETVVNGIEKQSNHEMNGIKKQQGWLAIISGFVLVLEMAIFIYPYHKRLVSALKKLKEQREEIDVQAEQLHKLNETQDLSLKGIKAGVWEWDVQTGEEHWSPRYFEMLGYTPGEIPATFDTFLNTLLHPEDKERVIKAVDNHLKRQIPYIEEVRLRCKDGQYRWVEAAGQALWDENGKPTRMAGSVIDIHQSIMYRNRLEYNEFMLEEAGRMAKLGSWDFDVTSNKMNWSANMYDIHETTLANSEILQQSSRERYPAEFHPMINRVLDRALSHAEMFDVELQLITAKGNLKWIRSMGVPVKDKNGKVVQLRGVYQDINDRKVKELELLKTKEELETTNRTKDKLFSIVAHDLRGPLAGLIGLVDLQSSDLISREEYLELTGLLKVNLDNLSGVMDNLLHWAQSQMGGIHYNPVRMHVDDRVNDAIALYGNALQLKKIAMHYEEDSTLFAFGDSDQVFLIIRNLLNNAIKFTPDEGKIEIIATTDGKEVRIEIKDNGVGMSYGTLQTILDNRYLFSTQGTMGEKGSGLGLNLCFEMAAKNGGRIEVESEPGKGTSFTLVLKSA